jgi:hypothetical protein
MTLEPNVYGAGSASPTQMAAGLKTAMGYTHLGFESHALRNAKRARQTWARLALFSAAGAVALLRGPSGRQRRFPRPPLVIENHLYNKVILDLS